MSKIFRRSAGPALAASLGAAGLVVAASLALGAAGAAAQGQPPVKIGAFLAITGPASFLGDPEAKTMRLYAEDINAKGGVLGRKLEVVIYDTAGDAKQAATFAKRLIEEDKVDILVAGTTTGETMAVVPLAEQAGIPFISLAGAAVIVEPVKKWVFKTPHTDRMAVEKVYAELKKKGQSKVAIIGGSGGFDQSCRAQAKDLAKAYDIQIVADETYGPQDTDMTPQLTKIKNAPGLQAVFGCGFGAATSITTKNYKQLGITAQLYFNHGVGSQQFIDGAGGAAEGVRLPAAALLVAEQLAADDSQRAIGIAYTQAYRARFNEPVSTFGGHAFDGLFLAVDAVKRAGGTDKAKVRDAIEKTKGFIGADGIFNMSATDHMGLDLKSFKMVEVKGSKFTLAE
jgi:branched-chain amino acid transport system substrate-binding protein